MQQGHKGICVAAEPQRSEGFAEIPSTRRSRKSLNHKNIEASWPETPVRPQTCTSKPVELDITRRSQKNEVCRLVMCLRCKGLFDDHAMKFSPRERWATLHNPLSSMLCSRCGSILPMLDPAEAMLSKLSQLSKFGLGADDRPILTPSVGRD